VEKLENYIKSFVDLLQGGPYLQAAVVVLITLLFARILTWFLLLVMKTLVARTRTTLDDVVIKALQVPLIYSVVMIGLSIAVRLLPLSVKFTDNMIAVLQSIGIFVWMIFFVRLSRILLRHHAAHDTRWRFVRVATLPLFENLAIVLIVTVAIYLVFEIWGIDMTAWLASAGILGIAVGFAAKDTLANLFSGVFIMADMPYKVGDYVVLDSGERGEIKSIGIRSTRMLTRDDVELTIPNSVMGNSKIVNESGGPHEKYRVRIPVGVAYGSDVDQVREVLMAEAVANDMVCGNPAPRVRFRALGDSALEFELLCWVDKPALRGEVIDLLLTAVYKRFEKESIEIPFNKQDIYIKQLPTDLLNLQRGRINGM